MNNVLAQSLQLTFLDLLKTAGGWNGGAMSDDERRRGEWRQPEERNIHSESSPIRSEPESSRIHLFYFKRILAAIAIVLIPLAAVGFFKLRETYAGYAAIVDQRLDQQAQRRRAGVY